MKDTIKNWVNPIINMNISVDVQYDLNYPDLPKEKNIKNWVNKAIQDNINNVELTVRIVDKKEGAQLNETWRKSPGPTNVLSFNYNDTETHIENLLGDIVLCAPVIIKEADEQGKSHDAHWAHMVIHGTLHLAGYDHIKPEDAKVMENIEIKILKELGFEDPYNNQDI
jgi:probable rRNA maturation factor